MFAGSDHFHDSTLSEKYGMMVDPGKYNEFTCKSDITDLRHKDPQGYAFRLIQTNHIYNLHANKCVIGTYGYNDPQHEAIYNKMSIIKVIM